MSGPLAGLRIGLVSAWASRLGGGVFEAVVAQAELIRSQGGEALIFALEDRHSAEDAVRFAPGTVTVLPTRGPRLLGHAPGMVQALLDARCDCLHQHGIWLELSRAATRWAQQSGGAYIISPHGMLDPWITGRGRWKKAMARVAYERASWRRADAFHALTESEAGDIVAEHAEARTLVIPNPAPPVAKAQIAPRKPQIAFVGRVHPKKNLLALVEAWHLARKPDDARLILAGWGEDTDVTKLQAAVEAAGPSVKFIGPIYGDAKQQLLVSSRFTVLPSLSEGLPVAMLEGWSAATPGVMTAACHLPEGFAAGAAVECGTDAASLTNAIELALHMDNASWMAMALAARGLAAGAFSADAVAGRWSEAYREVIASRV